MGTGKKLKEILDSKGTNVRQIAKATGSSATTLYSIIQQDSNIRFDFALRLANELKIDVNEICSASHFSGAITEEVIQHKKKAIRKLNQLLEDYISNGNQDSLKKVDLLSYWIEEYASYIQDEKPFVYKRLKSYKRGDRCPLDFLYRK